MITNQQLDLYNEVALEVLKSSKYRRSRVKLLAAARQAALEMIINSDDGLHLPESTRNVGAMVLMNSLCNKQLRPIDGSCCQTIPPPNLFQKLSACLFLGAAVVFVVLHVLGYNRHRRPVPPDVESLEEKKPAAAAAPLGPKDSFQALCRMGVIMLYFYLCDRADVFMKEQKFYTHSTFFIPLIYILVLGVFYSENSKEAVIHGMMFAFIYLVLQKRQVLSEGKGEALFPAKISNLLLFLCVVLWFDSEMFPSCVLTDFGLHPNQEHSWLCPLCIQLIFLMVWKDLAGGKMSLSAEADTKGILVLIPGSPTLNILVSTFIFVCVAHEVSLITNDLAQVVIPKDSMALLRRLGAVAVFSLILLLLSSGNRLTPGT
ncbi:hypothetical protein XENOCAPTIV_022813 [Xenoophorus captivus]|uniref:Cas1p 10 TM acyl transferase domain-containing protein n=1 Tax=Xenoophorus captivus TaxID=1517983 RepID=A0ABV0RL72_9TELE